MLWAHIHGYIYIYIFRRIYRYICIYNIYRLCTCDHDMPIITFGGFGQTGSDRSKPVFCYSRFLCDSYWTFGNMHFPFWKKWEKVVLAKTGSNRVFLGFIENRIGFFSPGFFSELFSTPFENGSNFWWPDLGFSWPPNFNAV